MSRFRRHSLAVLTLSLGAAGWACSPAIDVPVPAELAVKQIAYGPLGAVELSWRVVVRVDGYLVSFGEAPGPPYGGSGLTLLRWPEGCGDLDAGARPGRAPFSAGDLAAPDTAATGDGQAAPDGALGALDSTPVADAGPAPDVAAAPDAKVAPDMAQQADALPSPDAKAVADMTTVRDTAPAADAPWPGVSASSPIRIPAHWCLERADSYTEAGVQPVSTPAARPRLRLGGLVAGRSYYFAVHAFRRDSVSPTGPEVSLKVAASKQGG